ncbi:MAG: NUDIX hydrolase [Eubacteriales bacterium]|nr:NUDIX hydrolase [Eubacteriales bacterium]
MIEDYITMKVEYPIGSVSGDDPSMVYPVNFGYAYGAADQEKQEVYLLGVDVPVEEYTGVIIARVHRNNDTKTLLVAAPENIRYNRQQIEEMIYFQEKYYDYDIEIINDEVWDAYDENEKRLGFDIPRSMAKSLPEGVYHVVVMIYTLTDKGRILVTQRARNKTYPLKWEVTGGSILKGESSREGAARELHEETGIIREPEELIPVYSFVDYERHAIYHSFMHMIADDTHVVLQEGETRDYMFLPYEEFLKLVKSERFVASERRRFLQNEQIINKKISQQIGFIMR